MDELPADAVVAVDCARISPGDAMSDRADSAELLDINVDEITGLLAFIAPDRFSRLQGAQLIQPQPTQNTADGSWRDAGLRRDLLTRPALAAQPLDLLDDGLGCRLPQPRAIPPILLGDTDQPICEWSASRHLRLRRRSP